MKVVILSKEASNLVPCVKSILHHEPALHPSSIIVVNDGAKENAEKLLPPNITWVEGIKPFVFARNANLGLAAANDDVVLVNDDATLETSAGFSLLMAEAKSSHWGLLSPGIYGVVGNERQRVDSGHPLYRSVIEPNMLCFVCVAIPLSTQKVVGTLDERFVDYGYDDNDYCRRVKMAGLSMGIYTGCIVSHGDLPSTFRHNKNIGHLVNANKRRYDEKWSNV